jgi:hypothetical protein
VRLRSWLAGRPAEDESISPTGPIGAGLCASARVQLLRCLMVILQQTHRAEMLICQSSLGAFVRAPPESSLCPLRDCVIPIASGGRHKDGQIIYHKGATECSPATSGTGSPPARPTKTTKEGDRDNFQHHHFHPCPSTSSSCFFIEPPLPSGRRHLKERRMINLNFKQRTTPRPGRRK